MKKSTIWILVILLVVIGLPLTYVQAASHDFQDVSPTHPNYAAINYLRDQGIVQGYPDGNYKPDQTVNRVEALKIILLGSEIEVPEAQDTAGFNDVDINAWFSKYVVKAKELGIVAGYSDGTFRPGNQVNLVENLKILLNSSNIDVSGINVLTDPFNDTPKIAWYASFVQYAKDKKLVEADASGNVYPAQGMTRGTLAEVMYRLIVVQEGGLDFFGQIEVIEEEAEEVMEEEMGPAVMEFSFQVDDSGFDPKNITVNKGDTLKLTFVFNKSNIYFAGLDIKSNAFETLKYRTSDTSNEKTVEFTAESTFTMSAYWPASSKLKGIATVNVQ